MMDRDAMVQLSRRRITAPFTLEESLTFYCPQENLEAFENPIVSGFHRFMTASYEPPVADGRTIMLILPCTNNKPYLMSREHLTVNSHLLGKGFEPVGEAEIPAGLEAHLPPDHDPQVLNNGLLLREGLFLHRFVISEPLALVPYELIYYYKGEMSPASRYEDPGLFEHRPNTVCPWRTDCTAIQKGYEFKWGDNEKLAYVQAHNKLVELIAEILHRLRPNYHGIIAYVSPRLIHRSLLSSAQEKHVNELRTTRRIASKAHRLLGVNDIHPGLVTIIPTKQEFQRVFGSLEERLQSEQGPITRAKVRGYFARGGGGATPLALPEALQVLDGYLA
jgi:hypothetical protein